MFCVDNIELVIYYCFTKSIFQKRGNRMIEHEKDILEKLGKALPHMSEFDKGYLTRMAEESARQAVDDEKKSKELVGDR